MLWKFWIRSIAWEETVCLRQVRALCPDTECEIPVQGACSLHGTHDGGDGHGMMGEEPSEAGGVSGALRAFPMRLHPEKKPHSPTSSPQDYRDHSHSVAGCQEAVQEGHLFICMPHSCPQKPFAYHRPSLHIQ